MLLIGIHPKNCLVILAISFTLIMSGCFTKSSENSLEQQGKPLSTIVVKEAIDTSLITQKLHDECVRMTSLKSSAEIVAGYRCNGSVDDSDDDEKYECFDSIFTIEKTGLIKKSYSIRTGNIGIYKELELEYLKNDTLFCTFKQFALERQFNEEYLIEESLFYYHNGVIISTFNRRCECLGCNITDSISTIAWNRLRR